MALDQTIGLDQGEIELGQLQQQITERFGDILLVNSGTWPQLQAEGWWWLADDIDGLDDSRVVAAQQLFGERAVILGDHWDQEDQSPQPEVSRRGIYVRDPILNDPTSAVDYINTQREIFAGMAGELFEDRLQEDTPTREELAAAEALSRMKPGEIEWIGAWAVFAEGVMSGEIQFEHADVLDLWGMAAQELRPNAPAYVRDQATRNARQAMNDAYDLLDQRDNRF